MTDQTKQNTDSVQAVENVDVASQPWFWEAPIGYPVSGFYVVNGELYGHSFTTSESYKLFEGGDFNDQNIGAIAAFAYDDKGDRSQSKGSNELWVEGYIQQNTDLNCVVAGDLDAKRTSQTVVVEGDNSDIVAFGGGGNSLGDSPLGVQTLGGATSVSENGAMPAWFHVALTYDQVPFYLEQVTFFTQGVDLMWELICFGTNGTDTAEGNASITI